MNIFFHGLKSTFRNFLKVKYIALLLGGFLATYILVSLGFDWWYFTYFATSSVKNFIWPGVVLGMFIPMLAPIVLFIYGRIKKKENIVNWAGLIGQAAFLGWFFSSFIKAFTGRIQPNMHDFVNNISTHFNFGFWQHGIFWGFPSSHTAVAFSVSVACVSVLSQKEKIKNRKMAQIIILLYALYIGLAVSISIHWFTDFLVGAIVGYIVGTEVGKSFKKII